MELLRAAEVQRLAQRLLTIDGDGSAQVHMGGAMDCLEDTIGRTRSLSQWLASQSRSLLDLYAELQGFTEPPPVVPSSLPLPPASPLHVGSSGERGRASLLRRSHSDCHRLQARLGWLLEELGAQARLQEGLQSALTGLIGLETNLGLILASLGPDEQEEEGEKEAAEQQEDEEDGPRPSHWQSKVEGYHLLAHLGIWLHRMVGELEWLQEGLQDQAEGTPQSGKSPPPP